MALNGFSPKWKYHPSKPAVIIYSEEEETKLGIGWQDLPLPSAADLDAVAADQKVAQATGDISQQRLKVRSSATFA